jgi:hypothetical protein
MRAFGRDLIRGGHYGQRSCEPRQQAEHMAAPTNAAKREKSSCQLGAVHTWHQTDMPTVFRDVRFQGQSGKHLLASSFSGFDAVDGAHSAASKCHRVVALEQTTLRGAVHEQG